MSAYVIVQIKVLNSDDFNKYKNQVPETLKPFGGEYLVRGGEMEVLEGEWKLPRCVVVKFPSIKDAKNWYSSNAYAKPKKLRQSSSLGNMIVVNGLEYF